MAGATRLSQLGAAAGFNLSDVQEFVVSSFTSPDWMQITLLSASIIYIAEFVLDIRQVRRRLGCRFFLFFIFFFRLVLNDRLGWCGGLIRG